MARKARTKINSTSSKKAKEPNLVEQKPETPDLTNELTVATSKKEKSKQTNSSKVWGGGKQENSFEDSEELQAKLNPGKTSKDQNPSKEDLLEGLSEDASEGLAEDASSNTNARLAATQNETHKLKRFSRVHIFGLSLMLLTLVLMGLIWWFFKAQEVSAPAGVVGYSSKAESQSKSSDHQKETDFINEFYKKYYYSLSAPENSETESFEQLKNSYLDSDFAATITGKEKESLLCTAENLRDPYTVESFVGSEGDLLKFKLSSAYSSADNQETKKEIVVKLKAGEKMRITGIDC